MKTKNLDGRELFGITLGENNSIEGSWKRYFEEVYNDEETEIGFVTKKVYTELYDKNDMQVKYRFLISFYQSYEEEDRDIHVYLYLVPNFEYINKNIIEDIQRDYPQDVVVTADNLRIDDLMWHVQLPVLADDKIYCTRPLKSFYSKKITDALETAAKVCEAIATIIGFYMDSAENRIGTTGWDYLDKIIYNEDPFAATLARYRKEQNNMD